MNSRKNVEFLDDFFLEIQQVEVALDSISEYWFRKNLVTLLRSKKTKGGVSKMKLRQILPHT